MIEYYVSNYVGISAALFFVGPLVHLISLTFSLESDWSLGVFLSKGLATGTAAIIPPFFFVFVQDDILQRIEGIEYYLAISALVIFYFAVQALIPKTILDRGRKSLNKDTSGALPKPKQE